MKRSDRIIFAVLVSILLHFFLLGMAAYFSLILPPGTSEPVAEKPVEVILVEDRPYQIADISPPEKEERPDDAKFLGLYDSKVAQETVSTDSGPSAHAAGKKVSHKEATEKLEKNPEKAKAPKMAGPGKEGYTIAAIPKPSSPKESAPDSASGSNGEDLFEGLSEDFFPNYKVGDKTYLNVLKYPKIGYFVRMKKVFRTTFNPIPSIRQSFLQIQKGQVEVVLGVTVDKSGKLADLMILRSSGLQAYDQEALRTIRDSAPFAKPPAELLNAPDALRMAWTFTVYL
ncbi:MAG TPA: TonB family protein [bacterium]|nr:TonB family protein [bacterium]